MSLAGSLIGAVLAPQLDGGLPSRWRRGSLDVQMNPPCSSPRRRAASTRDQGYSRPSRRRLPGVLSVPRPLPPRGTSPPALSLSLDACLEYSTPPPQQQPPQPQPQPPQPPAAFVKDSDSAPQASLSLSESAAAAAGRARAPCEGRSASCQVRPPGPGRHFFAHHRDSDDYPLEDNLNFAATEYGPGDSVSECGGRRGRGGPRRPGPRCQ